MSPIINQCCTKLESRSLHFKTRLVKLDSTARCITSLSSFCIEQFQTELQNTYVSYRTHNLPATGILYLMCSVIIINKKKLVHKNKLIHYYIIIFYLFIFLIDTKVLCIRVRYQCSTILCTRVCLCNELFEVCIRNFNQFECCAEELDGNCNCSLKFNTACRIRLFE